MLKLVEQTAADCVLTARAVSFVSILAHETQAENPVDDFDQVEVLMRLCQQATDQIENLDAAFAIIMEISRQTVPAPFDAGIRAAPRGMHGRFIESGTQAIARTEHVVATDIRLFAQALEIAHFVLEQLPKRPHLDLIEIDGHVRERAQKRTRRFEQWITRRENRTQTCRGDFARRHAVHEAGERGVVFRFCFGCGFCFGGRFCFRFRLLVRSRFGGRPVLPQCLFSIRRGVSVCNF